MEKVLVNLCLLWFGLPDDAHIHQRYLTETGAYDYPCWWGNPGEYGSIDTNHSENHDTVMKRNSLYILLDIWYSHIYIYIRLQVWTIDECIHKHNVQIFRNIFQTFYAINMNDGLVLQIWWKISQCKHLAFERNSFAKCFAQHSVFYKISILINVDIFQNACHVYSIESVSMIRFSLWVIFHAIHRVMCFQLNHILMNIYTSSYYHHNQMRNMNHSPLLRVRLWNNGMRRMSWYVIDEVHL